MNAFTTLEEIEAALKEIRPCFEGRTPALIVQQLRAALEALKAAREDSARLDWIERTEGDVSWSRKSWAVIAGQPEIMCIVPDQNRKPIPTFETLRQAIDAAMRAEK